MLNVIFNDITVCYFGLHCQLFWPSLPVHSGSLKRTDYPKQICLTHPLSLNVFTALKGTHFYISEKAFGNSLELNVVFYAMWKRKAIPCPFHTFMGLL